MTKAVFQAAVRKFSLDKITVSRGRTTWHVIAIGTKSWAILPCVAGARTEAAAVKKAETLRRWLEECH